MYKFLYVRNGEMKLSKIKIICGVMLTICTVGGVVIGIVKNKESERKVITNEKDVNEKNEKKQVTDLTEFSKKYTEKLTLCEKEIEEFYLEYCKEKNEITEAKRIFAIKTATIWDDELKNIYDELKEILTTEEFRKLEVEQIEWIKKRDRDINMSEGKILDTDIADKVGVDTRSRCYELINVEVPKIIRECKEPLVEEIAKEEKKEHSKPKPVPQKPIPPVVPTKPVKPEVDQTERFKALIELPCHCIVDNPRYKDLPDYIDCTCRNATAESLSCNTVTCSLPLGCDAGCAFDIVPFCEEHDPLGFEAHNGHVNDDQSIGYCEYGISWEKP